MGAHSSKLGSSVHSLSAVVLLTIPLRSDESHDEFGSFVFLQRGDVYQDIANFKSNRKRLPVTCTTMLSGIGSGAWDALLRIGHMHAYAADASGMELGSASFACHQRQCHMRK